MTLGTPHTALHATCQAPATGAPATAQRSGQATSQVAMCRQCMTRIRLAAYQEPEDARCECGARLYPFAQPAELTAPPRGVLPRLIRFWIAGREDAYWGERRFFRPACAERAGVSPRAVRFAYESGRRAGERLRAAARSHYALVQRMRGVVHAQAVGAVFAQAA